MTNPMTHIEVYMYITHMATGATRMTAKRKAVVENTDKVQ